MSTSAELVDRLRLGLAELADADRAAGQQRYMKSTMPFRGVQMPEVRRLVRDVTSKPAPWVLSAGEWQAAVIQLWEQASYREERHAAIRVADAKPYRDHARNLAALPLYERLIRSGAWWDLVDATAPLVGDLLVCHPGEMSMILRRWATDDDIWIRRSAIISQLGRGEATDSVLLLDCINPSLGKPEFFLRKAIGWALRQYARTDPEWVRGTVQQLGSSLSPLSRREALKQIQDARESVVDSSE